MIHPLEINVNKAFVVDVENIVSWGAGVSYPSSLALLYDADKAPTRELTSKGHKFNSSILSPQYQRNAAGSYTDVGAKPAVDVFDGEKWLRSCGAITNLFSGDTSIARSASLTSGAVYALQVFGTGAVSCSYGTATVATPLTFTATETESVTFTPTGATYWMLTSTAYPVPYVPPGVTQPASNATTTNGCWFILSDGSPMWKALTGEPLTLATRVRMGVGSADLPNNSNLSIVSCAGVDSISTARIDSVGNAVVHRSYDGATNINRTASWPRNSIIDRVTQVNTAGTHFRIGYMIEGTNTTIQWSSWQVYDGSFNPSTLYHLMLGYNNPYPMWFNKIAVWNKQVDDAAILEALN